MLLVVAASGCFDPFRVRVDPDVVGASDLDWKVHVGDKQEHGILGATVIETRYSFDPDDGPPFPGVLQVFSIREKVRTPTDELLERTRDLVEQAVVDNGVDLDRSKDTKGERRIDSGVRTTWLGREGTTQRNGTLFDEESRIRILAEVGHDGKSSTSFVVIGLAQVAEQQRGPLPGVGGEVKDVSTWLDIAGDPSGSVNGATWRDGFVYHLETHG